MELDRIIQGDALSVLRTLPSDSVDLILTDPPYGKKASKGTHGFGATKNRRYQDDWDIAIPKEEVFEEILRVSRHAIIFGGNYFAHYLPPGNCWIVWDKKGDKPFNPFADCELLWTNFTKPVKKYTFLQQGFITESKDKRFHPTQKPTELLRRILNDFSSPGELILDPFLGSGSTALAAKQLGRHFIGIEREPEYVKIAEQRLKETQEPLLTAH